ncbi:IclR family transcriptional regulator [Paenibacillus sp. HJGM_3]|uniref:IclR family transcriptional regulator n=1 Tax=Paenibacillus sp. HJGM_3 TaxID=3379816 RepID=UPI00385CD2EF
MKPNRYNVPALEKGLLIIETLARSDQPLGITDLYALCGLPKSSVFMILSTLEDLKFVEKLSGDKYKLTLKLYNLGELILNKLDIRAVAHPYMEQVAAKLGSTVHLAQLEFGKAVYIDKVNGPGFVQFSSKIGLAWSLHTSAVGKALAAYLPEKELDRILEVHGMESITPNTITEPAALKASLEKVRVNGYSVEDEEGELGIRCIGAPIRDSKGEVVAAISVTALKHDLPSDKFGEVGAYIADVAMEISRGIGYSANG